MDTLARFNDFIAQSEAVFAAVSEGDLDAAQDALRALAYRRDAIIWVRAYLTIGLPIIKAGEAVTDPRGGRKPITIEAALTDDVLDAVRQLPLWGDVV